MKMLTHNDSLYLLFIFYFLLLDEFVDLIIKCIKLHIKEPLIITEGFIFSIFLILYAMLIYFTIYYSIYYHKLLYSHFSLFTYSFTTIYYALLLS